MANVPSTSFMPLSSSDGLEDAILYPSNPENSATVEEIDMDEVLEPLSKVEMEELMKKANSLASSNEGHFGNLVSTSSIVSDLCFIRNSWF